MVNGQASGAPAVTGQKGLHLTHLCQAQQAELAGPGRQWDCDVSRVLSPRIAGK